MKKKWLWCLLALIAVVCIVSMCFRHPDLSQMKVSTGKLEIYNDFPSKYIKPRAVRVWLPDGYEKMEKCSVLYMHDGQMLFDDSVTWNHQEWQVDEVIGRLIADGKVPPCIVVAIDNSEEDRINEYFPCKTYLQLPADVYNQVNVKDFTADNYLKFLVEELKPFIDSHYKTFTDREHTAIMGSSMGGLISLYAICEYPQVYGAAGCMSTHLSLMLPDALGRPKVDCEPWAEAFCSYVKKNLPSMDDHYIYMDRGTVELDGSYAPYQDKIDAMFRSHGWDANHYDSRVYEGHEHNETCWAKRLDQPLQFLIK